MPVRFGIPDAGHAASDSSRVILEANGKSLTGEMPLPNTFQRFVASPKISPCFLLLGQKLFAQ
jgi:hypothetical protein